MKRRDFIKLASTGALLSAGGPVAAAGAEAGPQREALPRTQQRPLPDLGSHWGLFQELSAMCTPALSFLADRFDDVEAWSAEVRACLVEHFYYAPDPCSPQPEVIERVDQGSYQRRRVLINTAPNIRNGIGFTKLVPGLYRQLDWPDLAGLHLPGALMTINGLRDTLYPLEAARAAVAKIERIFTKAGARQQYEGVFFDGPHQFNRAKQVRAFAWLEEKLT